ncbi:MAG: Methyltransferase type 11 [Bacteroidetes bacterium]|nr:Methyltransferase type 11 [Bacteroidota bacterium]
MPSGYTVLPLVYDRWQKSYGKDYSGLILPRVLATLKMFDIRPGTMLDLACGTGSLALHMERRRWKVWGVDASELMIEAARAKVRGPRVPIRFLKQDMRELRLPEQVDLTTCLFDSVNHLPGRGDLLKTFRAVAAALKPGGFFVFDTNNERCFRKLWTRDGIVRHRDFTMFFQNIYDRPHKTAYSRVTLFLKRGEVYDKAEEIVCERYFPRAVVTQLLQRAGLTVLRVEDFNFTGSREVGRIKTWWVAKRTMDNSR